jgi:hypothetical protein
VIAGTSRRGGSASSARSAASIITEAVATARAAGCTGTLIVRMDSAFYGSPACSAARQADTCFSVTVRANPRVRTAIAATPEGAWTAIRYPVPPALRRNMAAIRKRGQAGSAKSKCPCFEGNLGFICGGFVVGYVMASDWIPVTD